MKITLSELREIIREVIQEEAQIDINWQKIFPALRGYKSPSVLGQYGGESPSMQLNWGNNKYTAYIGDFTQDGDTNLKISSSFNELVSDWGLSITNDGLGFESLDNQNLKTFESMIGSLGLPTDSKSYMRKIFTKGGKSTVVIMYRVGNWLKYDPNTVISTIKGIIGSMRSSS